VTGKGVLEEEKVSEEPEERVLEEVCPFCGYPTLEEKRRFKGERLAVSVCLNHLCTFFDWEIPEAWMDEYVDEELFEKSEEWAEVQAQTLKREFLSKSPVKITVTPTINHVEEYLNSRCLARSTRGSYHRILSSFLEWFNKKTRKGAESTL